MKLQKLPILLGIFFLPIIFSQFVFDNYSQPKWLAVYWLSFVCLALVCCNPKFKLPMFSATQKQFILLWFVALVIAFYRLWPLSYKVPVIDRMGFAILVLYTFHLFRRNRLSWSEIALASVSSGAIVAVIGLFQATTANFAGGMPYFEISSTFGHVNMAAEFLGICVLLAFYLGSQSNKPLSRAVLTSVLLIIVVFLYVSSCRSVLLGLSIVSILWASQTKGFCRALCIMCLLISALGLVAPGAEMLAPKHKPGATQEISAIKKGNEGWRTEVWRRTLDLIRDHPEGVGIGKFEFGFIPYRTKGALRSDDMVEKSPHNEFLRFLAEDGILLTVLGLLALICIVAPLYWVEFSFEILLVLAFALYFFVQMLFQFPAENAVPFLYAALFLGFSLSKTVSGETVFPGPIRVLFFCLLVMFGKLSFDVTRSKYLEANHGGDFRKIEIACEALPTNWRVCLDKARMEIESQQLNEGEKTLFQVLRVHPYHFTAAYYLGILNFKRGNPVAGCSYLSWYNSLFGGQSWVLDDLKKYCPEPLRNELNTITTSRLPLGPLL